MADCLPHVSAPVHVAGVSDTSLDEDGGQAGAVGHVDERECNRKGEAGIGEDVLVDDDDQRAQEDPEGGVPAVHTSAGYATK